MPRSLRTSLFAIVLSAATCLTAQVPRSAYVLNTVGENLSVVNLETGTVTRNAVTLGVFANEIVLDGERLFAVNSGLNEIQVIDIGTLSTLRRIDTGSGTNPWGVDIVDGNTLVTSLLIPGEALFVDRASGQSVRTVPVGGGPQGVLVHDGRAYVANTGFNGSGYDPGVVSVIDLATYAVTAIPVSLNPQKLAVTADGRIAVACSGNYADVPGMLNIIDPAVGAVVDSAMTGIPVTWVAANALGQVYLGTYGFGLFVYNVVTGQWERDAGNLLPGGPGVAFDADNRAHVVDFAADSLRVFAPDHSRLAAYGVGDGPVSVAVYDPAATGLRPEPAGTAERFVLEQNWPNPFNPTTTIRFGLPAAGVVNLAVYDVLGRPVAGVLREEPLRAGWHEFTWDGRDDRGVPVASGVYLYRLRVGDRVALRKMTLVR